MVHSKSISSAPIEEVNFFFEQKHIRITESAAEGELMPSVVGNAASPKAKALMVFRTSDCAKCILFKEGND